MQNTEAEFLWPEESWGWGISRGAEHGRAGNGAGKPDREEFREPGGVELIHISIQREQGWDRGSSQQTETTTSQRSTSEELRKGWTERPQSLYRPMMSIKLRRLADKQLAAHHLHTWSPSGHQSSTDREGRLSDRSSQFTFTGAHLLYRNLSPSHGNVHWFMFYSRATFT